MKYRLYLLLFNFFILFSLSAQKIDLQSNKNLFSVLESTENKVTVQSSIKALNFSTVKGNSTIYSGISLNGYVTNHKVGSPDLPTLNKLIDIPYGASIEINILSKDL